MAFKIETQISIQAPASRVWKILTRFEAYPEWNPFVKRVEGEMKTGNRLLIQAGNMTFRPTLQIFRPSSKIQWLGSLWFRGLFDGQHSFELQEQSDGSTVFLHYESFQGLLVPLFKKKLQIETRLGFEAMNEKLKQLAEE